MIKYLDLKTINAPYEHAADEVLRSGWYLKGDYTRRFEEAYAAYIGTKYCIGCGNGFDALTLILRAYIEMGVMKQGDEVIVPANTYIASILAISECGLKPVLVEPSPETLQIDDSLIEQAITPRTRAIMIVHLYGRCAYTSRIGDICRNYGLKLIEDNAQAHGCTYLTPHSSLLTPRKTGSLGDAGAHSFYPTKNLGAFGDAGAVTTNDEALAQTVEAIGNYGSSRKYIFDYRGRNSRMDEIQAAILLAKLPHLDADNQRRKEIAARYEREVSNDLTILRLDGNEQYSRPSFASRDSASSAPMPSRDSVYHIFPVFSPRRDELQQYLLANGVETQIHYPIPPHKQKCYQEWNHLSLPITEQIHAQELSIPCHQAMTKEETEQIVSLLNSFC